MFNFATTFSVALYFTMNTEQFRSFSKTIIDYVADYMDNIRKKPVLASVEPGYLQHHFPEEAPSSGQPWQNLFQDLDKIILPGLTHWHSPHFHAYYPTANSYPGVVGELMLAGLGIICTDGLSSPACVDLELKMLDWLAQIIGLPTHFLNTSPGPGGGSIQNSASDSTLTALLAAKKRAMRDGNVLVAYTSEESNSSVEKAGRLASMTMRLLPVDEEGRLRGSTLLRAIVEDLGAGLSPCCVVATLGTTGTCAFDKLDELGPVCQKYNLWLHVDAAYGGSAFACPEYRYLMEGVEFSDSFVMSPHKWMLVNSDCSAMWFKDTKEVENVFNHNSKQEMEIQHWQIPSTRRFRALKLWFVLRIYGVEGIQKHIRHQISLAKYFSELVASDERFELVRISMGLICFRVRGHNDLTQQLIDKTTAKKNIFIMPYYCRGRLVVRFVICSRLTQKEDVLYAWNEIQSQLSII